MNKSPLAIASKAIQSQDFYTRVKKQIIYKSLALDGNRVLEVLRSLTEKQIRQIGQEFLYVTSRKFAKCQPIERFAAFLEIMIQSFGLDTHFLKTYLNTERDSAEVQFLLDYISRWTWDKELLADTLHQSTIYYLEKFAAHGILEEFYSLFTSSSQYLSKDFLGETLLRLFQHFLECMIQKQFSAKDFRDSLSFFLKKGLSFDLALFKKILELLTKNQKEEEFVEIVMQEVELEQLELDLVAQNMLIDYYCVVDKYEKAEKIFDSLLDQGKPDSFTYSILIKGLKKLSDESVKEKAMTLFRKYKRNVQPQKIVVYNSLLDLLVQQGDIEKVGKIFDDAVGQNDLKPDEITFNTIIKGCCKNKDLDTALIYFKKMRTFQLQPNRITYNSLMDLAVKVEKMPVALELVMEMQEGGITPDSFTYSIILNGLKLSNSSENLVRLCLKNIKKVILADEFKQDQILFNSILDVATKYNLLDIVREFHELMKNKGVRDSPQTCTYLIQAYTQADKYEEAIQIFMRMLQTGMKIKESSYGLVLECCTRNNRIELALELYDHLKDHFFNHNSIVFTTLIKGYLQQKEYQKGLAFFNSIKHQKELPGIIITYNCALDIYANIQDIEGAIALFEEIEAFFKADLISYSTIIKALCQSERKALALEYLKKMIKSKIKIDVSVINLFLESCSTKDHFKLAEDGYKFAMMQGIEPNEITFGIMVKVFGFARNLEKAFDLLDLMEVYGIKPSIIIFTNLIHISFYCRDPRRAELAFSLFRKHDLDGDALLYSKIIDGLIRFRHIQKVPKYIKYCLEEKCTLKEKTIESILKYFKTEEMQEKLEQIKSFASIKKKPHKNVHKFVNNYNLENPKKYKKQIREQRIQTQNPNTKKEEREEDFHNTEQREFKPNNYSKSKKQMVLHNFRKNKATD